MRGRLFAIGDVHGCRDEMLRLVDALPLDDTDVLVFLGDYVDRGPDSSGVVAELLAVADRWPRTVFLRGNHEDLLLDFLDETFRYGDAFMLNGGRATAASYGLRGPVRAGELREAIPAAHREFLRRTLPFHRTTDVVCVHAGIRPGIALSKQSADDLLWIREEFLRTPHGLSELVVFGHTPHRDVVTHLPGKLGIDTGCVYGGMLTAVELPSRTAYQIRREQRTVEQRVLADG